MFQDRASLGFDSGSDSDEDTIEAEKSSSQVETTGVVETVQSVTRTLRTTESSTDIKLSSMVRLRDMVLKMKDRQLEKVTKDAAMSELLDVWTLTAKRTMLAGSSPSAATSTVRENWKMMELIYQLLVKISDRSDSFSRQLAKTDLLRHTINILGNQQHQAHCTNEPYASATSWMTELLGNCYDGFEEARLQERSRQLVDFYSESECENIQIKAGQTKMMIAFKNPMKQSQMSGGPVNVGTEEIDPRQENAIGTKNKHIKRASETKPRKETSRTKNERESGSISFTTGSSSKSQPSDFSAVLSDLRKALEKGTTDLHSLPGVPTMMLDNLQQTLLQLVGDISDLPVSKKRELRKALSGLRQNLSQMEHLESSLSQHTGRLDAERVSLIESVKNLVVDLERNLSREIGEGISLIEAESSEGEGALHDRLREYLRERVHQHLRGDHEGDSRDISERLQSLAEELGGESGAEVQLGEDGVQIRVRAGSEIQQLLENVTKGSAEKTKAERQCRFGMPRVYTEKIKDWFHDQERWKAFNEDCEMWTTIKESFEEMVEGSRHSPDFGKALCKAGVIGVLHDILSNSQIQGGYMRNDKTKLVVVGSLQTLLHTAKLKRADKFISVAKVWDVLQGYLISDEVNTRGHAVLIVSYISRLEGPVDCFNMTFKACDIKMLVATHNVYENDAGAMGDFLAKTNFPELCVRELRNFVVRDPGNEDVQDEEWGDVLMMLKFVLAASHESDILAKRLTEINIVEPIQTTLSSSYFQARAEEMRCGILLKTLVIIVRNCVRLGDETIKKRFLVPNLWPHIYPLTTFRRTDELKNLMAFLAFIHMHGVVQDGESRQVTIDQFPKLNRAFDDIKYINSLWHRTKRYEHEIMGNYLAATGGATVHVQLLADLVENFNTITSGENQENFKKLMGNMNNLALVSTAFSQGLCRSGLLGHLKTLMNSCGLDQDLSRIQSHETELLDYSVSCAHACAKHAVNMPFFRSADISATLCRFMMADVGVGKNVKRRATTAVIYIRQYDPEQVRPHIARHRVTSLTEKELQYYHHLGLACKKEEVEDRAGDLLVELGVAETMGRKLRDLVQNGTLMTAFALTKPLMTCMINYTKCCQKFTVMLQNVEVLATCQDIIRDAEYREDMKEEKKKTIVDSALNILLNCAQYDCTHTTLHNLKVSNELLQFTHTEDIRVQSFAILAIALLVREENVHILRSSSKSGVMRFLVEKLEDGINADEDDSVSWSSTCLLKGLLNVASNDSNKAILVYDGILCALTPILIKGSPEDKQLAANLAWSLTFHEENKYYVQQEHELMDVLGNLSNGEACGAKISAKGALCQLEMTRDKINREIERQTQQNLDNIETETRGHDVYLSYHPKSERLFSQLRNSLEGEGFKVTSVNHNVTSHDIFTQMTSAIEKSRVVIVEVSRRYQQSLFCRTEAEYSYNLLTPLIPVRTEPSLQPLSWLARVCMGRPMVDFPRNVTRNEFEARESQLLKEIKHALRRGQNKE